ncbi:MAG: ATP-grasp domain-containing protein [Clostridia bacterium]|nr:ATP-grasp domain-containing protein [Clostridia bacterium]
MKKILIIGASILQLPAIKRAKELGYYVGVVDYDPNAVGIPFADEYFNVSTIDIDGVVKCAEGFCPDGIMTLATDMPMRSIAAACERLGLHGISFDTAVKSTDKAEMIKAFEAAGVEHPWYFIVRGTDELEKISSEITYPCISKPTDNSGSRGVMLIESEDELRDAVAYSSKNGRSGGVIVEEYMKGPEVSVEIITLDGEPHVLNVTDKLTTGAPHFVEMGHSQPSALGEENVERIRDLAKRAVRAVGIKNGPAHVEIMLTEDGPKMVELGARMGGDCITTHLVPLSTGIDMIEATIRIACGERPDIVPKYDRGSAIRYFSAEPGIIKAIDGVEEAYAINGVKEISFVKTVGDELSDIGSSTDRIGFVIAEASNVKEAVAVCEAAMARVKITTERK